ncbi:MAG TPA: hypothetical protein VJ691_19370 [Vicinamibacterales bacterium]|nr:hypothetical protein [Vicinamibacterales bacterium]
MAGTRACVVCILLAAATACGAPAPPAPPQSQSAPAPAPVAEQAPASEAIARADALLEDFRRREAAQAKFDRENPPPKFVPIPRTLVEAARQASASIAADTSSNSSDASAPPPVAPAASAPAAPARDETWWRREVQSLQAALDKELARLAEAEKLNFKYGYNDAQAEYKRRAAAVATARQALDRLRDEARRSGIPPGWLR